MVRLNIEEIKGISAERCCDSDNAATENGDIDCCEVITFSDVADECHIEWPDE